MMLLNGTSNNYSNDTYSITKTNKLFNITDNNYFIQEINTTSKITNNITRHNHNNYEHSVINKIHKHIKNINNYDTEIHYYNKKPLNNQQYYNFYNDYFHFRKIGNTSLSQQADTTNNIIETNTQTINYIGNNYLNNNKIVTIILAPPPLTGYLWQPETTDNVVPGLDSILTYIQSKYATLTALQNSVRNLTNIINTEIQNLQTEINNIEIPNPQNVNKTLSYHTNHTDFLYQRNTTNNDNRKSYVKQQNYFTYQRRYNTNNLELMIQTLQLQINNLQTQINNINSGGGGDDLGTY